MDDMFAIWPDLGAFAADLGVPYSTAASWRRRGVPERRLPDIVAVARRRLSIFEAEETRRVAETTEAARRVIDGIEARIGARDRAA